MELKTYQRKRNFKNTPEPAGKKRRADVKNLQFVIQKHSARALHYDFRLEMGGALASWAVPKGPSLNPKERRLAVQVEDHPIDYGNFEGTIPKGQYGAGTVILWDRGSWTPDGDPIAGRRKGRLKFHLNGEKLKGGWTLVRMKSKDRGKKTNWLLIKERDPAASKADIVKSRPQSVKSSRSSKSKSSVAARRSKKPRKRRGAAANQIMAVTKAMAKFYPPQLATLVDRVPPGEEWLHELKFDGYRMICRIDKGSASFLTREAHDWTARFSAIAKAAEALPVRQAVLDGEIVALKDDGTTDFQLLQNSLRGRVKINLVYFVFDLLYLEGRDLTGSPLLARKEQLEKLIHRKGVSDAIRFSDHWIGQGAALFKKACDKGLEGIISKRKDRPYRPTRSRDWLKIKCVHGQEFVIGGYSDPAGARSGLGALLLGVYDDDGSLHYAGRVGTGFSEKTLADLRTRLDKLGQHECPFVEALPGRQSRGVHWVKPELVGEVVFTQWTQDNLLRHPVFKGLREDKPALEVRREKPASTARIDR